MVKLKVAPNMKAQGHLLQAFPLTQKKGPPFTPSYHHGPPAAWPLMVLRLCVMANTFPGKLLLMN